MLGDLVFVLQEIKRIIEKYGLVDLYTNYANTLEAISKESTPELQASLKDYRTRINQAHGEVKPQEWSYSQAQIFDKFTGQGVLGEQALKYFQNALFENQANVPGAVTEIRALGKNITDLMGKTDNVLSSLGKFTSNTEDIADNEVVVQIVFDNKMAVDNLIQLSEQSKSWKDIIRAYSLLTKEAPERTRIVSISKSSPLQWLLVSAPLIANALKATITPFLNIWNEVLELRIHALALEDKKLSIAGKRLELMKEIDEYEQGKIMETVKNIAEVHKAKGLDEGTKNEAIIALSKAGPDLYHFITSGGKVDTSMKNKDTKKLDSFKLEPKYRTALLLQEKVQNLLSAGEIVKPAKKKIIIKKTIIKKKLKIKMKSKTKLSLASSKLETPDKPKDS